MKPVVYILCLMLVCPVAAAEDLPDCMPCQQGCGMPAGPDEPAMPPPGPLGMPAYPMVNAVPFEGTMHTNEVPMDAMVVMTGDPIKQVLEYYRLALKDRGAHVVQHMFSPDSGYVGFYDVDSGTMRMATVVSRPDGGSMIVLSSMDPMPLLEQPAAIPPDLPEVPGAVEVVTSDVAEGSSRQRTVRFTLPGTTPSSAHNLLLHAAKKKNWTPAPAEKPFSKEDLFLRRGNEMCIIQIHALPAGPAGAPSTSITFIVVERGSKQNQEEAQ